MGCCLSWLCGKPEENTDHYKPFSGIHDDNMPKRRRQDDKDEDKPARRRRSDKYLVPVSEWDKMEADLHHYKSQVTQKEARIKDDDRKNAELQRTVKTLQDKNNNITKQLKVEERAKDDALLEVKNLQENYNRLMKKLKKFEEAGKKKEDEINELKKQNQVLVTRLSEIVGNKLTDNNPNIADLSDENRPTKLAEQYSELYDNEWSDAITALNDDGIEERHALDILRDMLIATYKLCERKAETQLRNLIDTVGQFTKNPVLQTQIIKQLKDKKKESYKDFLPELDQAMQKQTVLHNAKVNNGTEVFRGKCLELCWLMCIQDPPVAMDCEIVTQGAMFDKQKYKEYTKTGKLVDYVVWPPLYLFKGGALLCKGTAQAMTAGKTSASVMKTSMTVKF